MIKKIGILTSGGDAPGMNSIVVTAVKTCIKKKITPYFIYEGYKGMVDNNIKEATYSDVHSKSQFAGTFIYSARLPSFKDPEVRKIGIANLKKHGIEAVLCCGGDGTYTGAQKLTEMGINCIGVPGTIDADISSTDYTIGFNSAVQKVVTEIDAIRATMNSHNRCAIVEVMGRNCGNIAIFAGLAAEAEVISTPENKKDVEYMAKAIQKTMIKHKNRSCIIVVTELLHDLPTLSKELAEKTGIEIKTTVIGHPQRGATPNSIDRFFGSLMAKRAIDLLEKGKGGKCIVYREGKITDVPILEALNMKKDIDFAEIQKEMEMYK